MNGRDVKEMMGTRDQIARIYADTRFPSSEMRMFAITTVWACGIARPPRGQRWEWVVNAMNLNWYQFWWLIGQDAPRYEPPNLGGSGRCEAPKGPRARKPGPCGKRGHQSFRVTDAATGQWRYASFCRDHHAYADLVEQAEKALRESGTVPEPTPNVGGLLPCYITVDWPTLYRQARETWKPPAVGVIADDWPVMTQVVDKAAQAAAPPLKLLPGAADPGTGAGPQPVPTGEASAPTLRVIKGGGGQ